MDYLMLALIAFTLLTLGGALAYYMEYCRRLSVGETTGGLRSHSQNIKK